MAVLVTTFGSSPGPGAFEYGVELALVADTDLELLHLHPERDRTDESPPGRTAATLADYAGETDLDVAVTVRGGDPAVVLPDHAAGVDCVVAERPRRGDPPGRDGLRRLLDGLSVPSVVVPPGGQRARLGSSTDLRCR